MLPATFTEREQAEMAIRHSVLYSYIFKASLAATAGITRTDYLRYQRFPSSSLWRSTQWQLVRDYKRLRDQRLRNRVAAFAVAA